jgi:hypothetical protein
LILSLARIIANSQDTLSQESIEALIHIGATLCKNSSRQNRARAEIADTMRESIAREAR